MGVFWSFQCYYLFPLLSLCKLGAFGSSLILPLTRTQFRDFLVLSRFCNFWGTILLRVEPRFVYLYCEPWDRENLLELQPMPETVTAVAHQLPAAASRDFRSQRSRRLWGPPRKMTSMPPSSMKLAVMLFVTSSVSLTTLSVVTSLLYYVYLSKT